MSKNSNTKKFVSNINWMLFQQIYSMVLSLVIGSLVARYLGPSNYGVLSYATTLISFFTIISRLGIDSIIINELVTMPQKQGTVLGTALVMRLISSVLSFIMVVMVILVIEPDDKLIQAVTILQALAIIFQVYEVFTYWFQSKLKMKNVVIAIICALTAVGLWRVFLLAKGLSVQWFALAASIQYIVTGIVVIFFYFSDKESPKLRFNYLTSKRLFLKSYHFIVSGLAVTCYSKIDKIMIKKIIDNEAVGIYTIAVAISILWEFVPHALINSSRPLILEKRNKSYEEYIKSFQMLLLGITLLGVAVDFALIILGKPIIRLLYGDAYIGAFLPLCFLIFSTNFAIIGTARSIWIIAEGHNKYPKYYILIGALVNIVLNSFLIFWMGITGAAIATLISQIVVALISPAFFKQTRPFIRIYFESFKYIKDLYKLVVYNFKVILKRTK